MKTKLKSIAQELDDCCLALANSKVGDLVWCCHHTVRLELLNQPFEHRIAYILDYKLTTEQAARFRCFRPWIGESPVVLSKALIKLSKARIKLTEARSKLYTAPAEHIIESSDAYDRANAECYKASAEFRKANDELYDRLTTVGKAKLHDQQWPDHCWENGKVLGT